MTQTCLANCFRSAFETAEKQRTPINLANIFSGLRCVEELTNVPARRSETIPMDLLGTCQQPMLQEKSQDDPVVPFLEAFGIVGMLPAPPAQALVTHPAAVLPALFESFRFGPMRTLPAPPPPVLGIRPFEPAKRRTRVVGVDSYIPVPGGTRETRINTPAEGSLHIDYTFLPNRYVSVSVVKQLAGRPRDMMLKKEADETFRTVPDDYVIDLEDQAAEYRLGPILIAS